MPTRKTVRPRRRHKRELDGGKAFIRDFRFGFRPVEEGDVEAFGEEFIAGATSNEPIGELARDETYATDMGGFVVGVYEDTWTRSHLV